MKILQGGLMVATFYYKDNNAPKPNKPNHIGTNVIVSYNDLILLELRSDSNEWGLIGGGLEINESLEEGAKRELFEESGIEAQHLEFFNIYSDPSRIVKHLDGNVLRLVSVIYVYKCDRFPRLIISHESNDLKFFERNEIASLNIVATHQQIIDDFIKG